MSAKKLYWRNRDGESPPQDAEFFWSPFNGEPVALGRCEPVDLPQTSSYLGVAIHTPQKLEWTENVAKVLNSGIEKVVLARRTQVRFNEIPNPFSIAAHLQKKSLGACLFCIETPEFSFLGATPERLFRREGRKIFVEAVAGTRKRGHTPEEDRAIKKELLKSDKDLREILPVQKFFSEMLGSVVFTPLSVHETAHIQHLYSQGEALLKDDISDIELVKKLHPTPALAGFPRDEALKLIQELEPFSRGLYGGVVGWSTKERSEWVVAIRCCLLEKNIATLFAGTGIVQGSHPDAEWEELNQKLKLFEGILL